MSELPGISLSAITMKNVADGGYSIRYGLRGIARDEKTSIFLAVAGAPYPMEITEASMSDVIDRTRLSTLLDLLSSGSLWGRSVDCRIVVKTGRDTVYSNTQKLLSPVAPLAARLSLSSIPSEQPKLTYLQPGRMIREIGGKQYFVHGSRLETEPGSRGFDCTTFPMALLGCAVDMSGKYGTALAQALGAQRCGVEGRQEQDVKAFFSGKGKGGRYVMWSARHVVLVKAAVIYEFTTGGFRKRPASSWPSYKRAPGGRWWVRRLTQPF